MYVVIPIGNEAIPLSPKKIIIAGTMAITITFGSSFWADKTNAGPLQQPNALQAGVSAQAVDNANEDALLEVLGGASSEEVYDEIYSGKTLAAIAAERGVDAQKVIDLQIAEMAEQLGSRLASGSLTLEDYQAQMAELPEIIANSVYGARA